MDVEYEKALEAIRQDYYCGVSDEEIFEQMIKDYLTREGGRLGYIVNGVYQEERGAKAGEGQSLPRVLHPKGCRGYDL